MSPFAPIVLHRRCSECQTLNAIPLPAPMGPFQYRCRHCRFVIQVNIQTLAQGINDGRVALAHLDDSLGQPLAAGLFEPVVRPSPAADWQTSPGLRRHDGAPVQPTEPTKPKT